MARYSGKTALVIGGGGGGIGAAIARAFAREGAAVTVGDASEEAGQALVADLARDGLIVAFVRTDATREEDVAALVSSIVKRHGRLDVAVNNVGGLAPGETPHDALHESTLAHWRAAVDINLTSCFLGMKHQIAQMLRQGGGAIANTASMAGVRVSFDSTASYAAAKAGVVHLTEHAAVRYAKDNIRVNVVAPGLTLTPKVARMGQATLDAMAQRTQPMGRLMTPEEIAAAFAWVCSGEASGVTGLTIPVAGGWAAH